MVFLQCRTQVFFFLFFVFVWGGGINANTLRSKTVTDLFLYFNFPIVTIQVMPGSKLFIQLIQLKRVKYLIPHFYIKVFFLKGEGLFADTVKEVRYLWVIFLCSTYSNTIPDMLKIHSKEEKRNPWCDDLHCRQLQRNARLLQGQQFQLYVTASGEIFTKPRCRARRGIMVHVYVCTQLFYAE